MPTTIGGKEIATDKSDHKAISPPAVSNIPPMTPPKPDGVPAPFPYMADTTSASQTASKLTVGGGKAVVEGSALDVAQPGNQASQPAPLHDLVTQAVNKKCTVTSGSGKVTAGGKGVSTTTDRAAMNVMVAGGQVAQQTGTLVGGGGADASSAGSKSHQGSGQTVGEPVNVVTGEVVDEAFDLSLPGLIPVEWKRLYASGFCDEATPLGRGGWTFTLHQWVEEHGDELVFRGESGRDLRLPAPAGRETRFVRSKRLDVTRQFDGSVEVFDLDRRLRRTFRASRPGGRALLRAIRDAWGNQVVLDHDGERLELVAAQRQQVREVFEVDATGALSEALSKLGAEPWHVEEGNRVRRTRDFEYDYDENGRRVKATRLEAGKPTNLATTYRWDVRDRLRAVSLPDGTSIRYFYDALGRRVRKEIRAQGANEARVVEYVWDGHVLACEIDSANGRRVFVHEQGTFVPLLQQERGRVYAYVNDQVGTPKELIDERGDVVWSAAHSAWGAIVATHSTAARVTTPFRLLGQYHDEETGLHYTQFRYFDPQVARWLSPDPIGLHGGNNLYGFNGSPACLVDPLGLVVETDTFEPTVVNGQMRPMGAEAVIVASDLGIGTPASRYRPAGFEGGAHPFHHDRGHLIARDLGGSGTDPRNLVTITGGSNHPTMFSTEQQVKALVLEGRAVRVRVEPQYAGDDQVPHTIKYEAFDARTGQRLFCNTIVNGYQKKNERCG